MAFPSHTDIPVASDRSLHSHLLWLICLTPLLLYFLLLLLLLHHVLCFKLALISKTRRVKQCLHFIGFFSCRPAIKLLSSCWRMLLVLILLLLILLILAIHLLISLILRLLWDKRSLRMLLLHLLILRILRLLDSLLLL